MKTRHKPEQIIHKLRQAFRKHTVIESCFRFLFCIFYAETIQRILQMAIISKPEDAKQLMLFAANIPKPHC